MVFPVPCTLMCLLRLPDWEKRSRHSLHWYGFSPEWMRRCFVRVDESENAFLHIRHLEKRWKLKKICFSAKRDARLRVEGERN